MAVYFQKDFKLLGKMHDLGSAQAGVSLVNYGSILLVYGFEFVFGVKMANDHDIGHLELNSGGAG